LSGLERNGGLRAALRAGGARLRANPLRSPRALRLALFAVLRIVLELLVVEKDLLACCKYELCAAVYTLQCSIGEFHGRLPPQEIAPKSAMARIDSCQFRFPVLVLLRYKGPDRT